MSSYHKQKGANYERKIAKDLSKKLGCWDYEFYRSPAQEKMKERKTGDVSLKWSTDPKENCILRDAHIEVSHRKNPRYLGKLEKAVDDNQGENITIYIGKKTHHDTEFAMLPKEDLYKLLVELQGWREENN